MENLMNQIECDLVKDLTTKLINEVWNPKETYPTFTMPDTYDVETCKKLHERAMAGFKNAFPQDYEEGLMKIENNIMSAKEGQKPTPLPAKPYVAPKEAKPAAPQKPAANAKPQNQATANATAVPQSQQQQPKTFGKVIGQNIKNNQNGGVQPNQVQPNATGAAPTQPKTTPPATPPTNNQNAGSQAKPAASKPAASKPAADNQQNGQQQQNGTAAPSPQANPQQQNSNKNNPIPESSFKYSPLSLLMEASKGGNQPWPFGDDTKPENWETMSDDEQKKRIKEAEKLRKSLEDNYYNKKGAERSKQIEGIISQIAAIKSSLKIEPNEELEKQLEELEKQLQQEQKKQSLDQNIQSLNLYTIRFTANYNEEWYKNKFKHGLWNGSKWLLKNIWQWMNSDIDNQHKFTAVDELTDKDKKALAQINKEMCQKIGNYYLTQFAGGDVAAAMMTKGFGSKLKDFLFGGMSKTTNQIIVQFRLAEDKGKSDGPEADAPEETTGNEKNEHITTPIEITNKLMLGENVDKLFDKFIENKIINS